MNLNLIDEFCCFRDLGLLNLLGERCHIRVLIPFLLFLGASLVGVYRFVEGIFMVMWGAGRRWRRIKCRRRGVEKL